MSRKKAGRPPSYRGEFDEQAFRLCLLGATDAELADAFGVTETAINNWKIRHPSFLESLTRGKDQADARVAQSLYRRALGYEHEAVKIVADAKTGLEHSVPYIERYPPDTTAAIFWLKNRQRRKWRDKHDIEHSGEIGGGVLLVPMSAPDEWATVAKRQQAALRTNGRREHTNGSGAA